MVKIKALEIARKLFAASCALPLFLFGFESMAWAQSDLSPSPSAENCPGSFTVVDLGTWTIDKTGASVFDYGGLLYQVTSSSVLGRDQVLCLEPSGVKTSMQVRDGNPVPLVQHFVDVDMGARLIQRASGDYVQDVVAGRVTSFQTNALAVAAIEKKIVQFFTNVETAADRGNAVSKGPNFACIFDAENPSLTEYGNYFCVASIEGLPHPDAYFQCSRWGETCFAIFQPASAIAIKIEAGPLTHWEEASRIKSISDAVSFWSDLILSSTKNFEASIVPRGPEDITETIDRIK